MDLTTEVPRSPREKMLGIVSLARTIDKAKAYNEGKLGEYDYDCPHDKPLFAFLGTDGAEFADKVKELRTDENIEAWVKQDKLPGKSDADLARFNDERMQWHPQPGSESEQYYRTMRSKIAPGRDDVVTWFDLLDLDEHRPVESPTQIKQTR